MTNEQINDALNTLEKLAAQVEQLDPLTPEVDAAIDDICIQAARIAQRLEALRVRSENGDP